MMLKKFKNAILSKNSALVLFVILILFVGYFFPTEPDVVIKMTSSGFVPEEITIKQGQTVRFLNTDTLTHWPAVHAHPTHSLYMGSDIRKCGTMQALVMFDSCRAIEPNEAWDFTFNYVGSWGYHDHILSRFTGRITVEPVENFRTSYKSSVSNFLANISAKFNNVIGSGSKSGIPGLDLVRGGNVNSFERGHIFTKEELSSAKDYESMEIMPLTHNDFEVRRIVYQLGVKRTLEKMVEELRQKNDDSCHLEAHFVGRAAYDVFGAEAFGECTQDCHSGCYHGVMENLFLDAGASEVLSTVKETCASLETVFSRYQCFHGVGHGVLSLTNFNLIDALDTCRDIGSQEAKEACYGGVFMENINSGLGESIGFEGHVTEWLSWDDLFFPCNTDLNGDLDAREWCYDLHATWLRIVLNNNNDAVISQCQEAEEEMRPICFKSFGRDTTHRIPQLTEELCAKVPEEYFDQCILGASKVVVDFYGPTFDNKVNDFCSALVDARSKEICYDRFIISIPDLFVDFDGQKQMCSTISEPYKTRCIGSL